MRTKLLFLYLFLLSYVVSSQQDSLQLKKYNDYFAKAYQQLYSQKDSAYFNLKKALRISENEKWIDKKANVLSYLIYVSSYHYNLPVMKKNMDKLDAFLEKEKDTLQQLSYYAVTKNLLELNQGNYYYKLEDYKRAKPYFLALYNRMKKAGKSKENITNLHSIYSFLTVIYTQEGKNDVAENFCDKARLLLNEYPAFFRNVDSDKMLLNNYLARIYNNQQKHSLAIPLLKESVKFYEKEKESAYKNSVISSYQALINSYILANNSAEALSLLQQSEKLYSKDNPFYKILQELYGDVYFQQKKYNEALRFYTKSLTLFKTYRNNKQHIDVALIQQKIAKTHLANKQLKKALTTINEAINNIRFNDKKLTTNNFITTSESIEILHLKSEIFTEIYQQKNEIKTLEKALKNSLFAIEILDEIKPTLENGADKQLLINKVYPLFETSLEQCFLLFEKTNNKHYFETAFFVLEKSKSTQLLDAVNKTKAIQFANVSSKIIDKEQQLLANVSAIETDMFTSNFSTAKQKTLIEAKESYQNFLDSIKVTQPKYHNLKYNYSVISFEEIRTDMKKSQGFIGNFFGKKYLYQLVFTKNDMQFLRQKITPSFLEALNSFYQIVSNIKKTYEPKKGFDLYEKLVPKLVRSQQQLIILPDGFLYYIPFEALSFQPKENSFLVQKTAISYANSFTLLKEQLQKRQFEVTKKMFAVAPEFYKTSSTSTKIRADFSPLIFNKEEVKNIANLIASDTLIGKSAILQNIENKLKNYSILHFATHASANDEYPDFSYLAFTPQQNKQNLWYVKQIYNTNLSADLVTLSACQTGIGKVENGEGSISLARAFSYAGASALVQSLWKVDDRSTSEIMGKFYKELSNGTSKSKALQIAKNNYLQTEIKELRHPFYWAGFVLNGNSLPIKSTTNFWWILVLVCLILVFIAYKKVKK